MAYRKFRRASSSAPRDIMLRYTSRCGKCGVRIAAGAVARYFPAAAGTDLAVMHLQCSATDAAVNAYAGDGLDSRYEDDCAAMCGL